MATPDNTTPVECGAVSVRTRGSGLEGGVEAITSSRRREGSKYMYK